MGSVDNAKYWRCSRSEPYVLWRMRSVADGHHNPEFDRRGLFFGKADLVIDMLWRLPFLCKKILKAPKSTSPAAKLKKGGGIRLKGLGTSALYHSDHNTVNYHK